MEIVRTIKMRGDPRVWVGNHAKAKWKAVIMDLTKQVRGVIREVKKNSQTPSDFAAPSR